MLNLLFDLNGRPRGLDDLKTLQEQTQYAIYGQFLGLPACVVSGCEIRPQAGGQVDIGNGLVFLESGIHRFNGAAGVTLPMELYLDAAVDTDMRPYFDGVSRACMSERKVAIRAVGGTGEAVRVMPEGVLRFEKAREALLREVGDLQFSTRIVATDYDTSGKGKYGTKAYGWQLSGNGTTVDIRGRFPVVADSRSSDYALGVTGGAAKVTLGATEVPRHTHNMGNAGQHTHNATVAHEGDDSSRIYGVFVGQQNGASGGTTTASVQQAGSHTHTLDAAGGNALGGTDEHENRPPYVALGAREWIGLL
ncbi:hypothetical protein IC235_17505 [Hymenobacter sp. BT664]|uniref:Tail fiber protein n=1 Tax=Hymenobacter montanus TaxID=2771359 RepID=A0A927GL02_9BACT|nr:hypothetical protein [Hymenobacter montanus]MBD2769689.1 hypothetical protein [Hymenobacter montanus]